MTAPTKAKAETKVFASANDNPTMPSASNESAKARRAKSAAKARTRRTAARRKAGVGTVEPDQSTAPLRSARRTPQRGAATARAEEVAPSNPPRQLSPEVRYRMIQDAAYYIAERHGFRGDPISFWFEAEREVDQEHPDQALETDQPPK